MTELDLRIQRLEDLEEIRGLQAHYAELCDSGFDPDALTALFTDDGCFEVIGHGRWDGADALRQHWADVGRIVDYALHLYANHRIQLETGASDATGRVIALGLNTRDGDAYWQGMRYENAYRKAAGRWRFRRVCMTLDFDTPYERSWAAKGAAPSAH